MAPISFRKKQNMITILTKSANYDPENINFFHNLYSFALEINYFPVLLSVRASACKVTEA